MSPGRRPAPPPGRNGRGPTARSLTAGTGHRASTDTRRTFDNDLDGFSSRVWDPSGAPSPFGGGFGVFVFDDGVEVGSYFGTPAWGGLGDEWINVTATGGMKFDEVRILGFGFGPTTLVDDLSWNVVPAPASVGLLGLAAIGGMRRRR